jgi:peroxiredoxin
MTQKACIKAGEQAPLFSLQDHRGNMVSLVDFKGQRVLLSFHPLAWTPVCATQMKTLDEQWSTFKKFNTVPLGISIDTVPSKKAWAEKLDITHLSLLSDFWPHGEVAKSFGVFREKEGFSERVNILINEDQRIDYVQRYNIPELPDIQEILTVLQTLESEV